MNRIERFLIRIAMHRTRKTRQAHYSAALKRMEESIATYEQALRNFVCHIDKCPSAAELIPESQRSEAMTLLRSMPVPPE